MRCGTICSISLIADMLVGDFMPVIVNLMTPGPVYIV